MDDYARPLGDHPRQQRAIETDGRGEVEIERRRPISVAEHRKAPGRGNRAARDMDNDIDPAEPHLHGLGNNGAACSSRDICGDIKIGLAAAVEGGSRRREDCYPGIAQGRRNRGTDPLAGPRHQRPLAFQLQCIAHSRGPPQPPFFVPPAWLSGSLSPSRSNKRIDRMPHPRQPLRHSQGCLADVEAEMRWLSPRTL